MLDLVFLGTGSGIPTPKRNLAAIWCRYEGECWLWDCGEGTQRQLFKAKLNFMKIDKIFITHWHADHWAGIIGLMQTMNLEKRTAPLTIYAPEAERFLGNILDLDYWGPRFKIKPVDVPYQGDAITVLHKTKTYQILSTPVQHGIPSVAYAFKEADTINVDIKKAEKKFGLKQGPAVGKLKSQGKLTYKGKTITLDDVGTVRRGIKVVYTGDTMVCDTVKTLATAADVLIHDATFGEEDIKETKHAHPEEVAKLAHAAGVNHLVLTHFSRRYTDVSDLVATAKKAFPKTLAATDYLHLAISDRGLTTTHLR
ncbi:MAG: ribonuclease Z [Nanoarchaeota archaeon]|nr:ribonuclease Z [Nanoarchaeota archaeon]